MSSWEGWAKSVRGSGPDSADFCVVFGANDGAIWGVDGRPELTEYFNPSTLKELLDDAPDFETCELKCAPHGVTCHGKRFKFIRVVENAGFLKSDEESIVVLRGPAYGCAFVLFSEKVKAERFINTACTQVGKMKPSGQ